MKIFKQLSVLLTLTFIAGIMYSCKNDGINKPSKQIEKLYSYVKSKDYEKAASLYCTGDEKVLNQDELKKVEGLLGMGNEKFEKKGGLDRIEVTEEIIDESGLNASVKFTVYYKNGDKEEEKAKLVKIDGNWYVKIG